VKSKRKQQQREPDENWTVGSSTVREPIHAPLTPRASKTRGPRQQADAPKAATTAATTNPIPFWLADFLNSNIEAFVQL
jgi:hypothetical protein